MLGGAIFSSSKMTDRIDENTHWDGENGCLVRILGGVICFGLIQML